MLFIFKSFIRPHRFLKPVRSCFALGIEQLLELFFCFIKDLSTALKLTKQKKATCESPTWFLNLFQDKGNAQMVKLLVFLVRCNCGLGVLRAGRKVVCKIAR